MRIDRRRALALLGLGAAGSAGQAEAQAGTFLHGVASGDPLSDRVVLWTRVTVAGAGSAPVRWEVAEDQAFRAIVRQGTQSAEAARDHTVKIDVTGLRPGREYWYRFTSGSAVSRVGRTKTLPVGATPDLVLAVTNCALHPGGLFNVYDAIARLDRLDAVVHLGDYIYEYGAGAGDYGMAAGRRLNRIPDPPHEIVSLGDYRRRHAQYRTDPDLQAAHARAPFICVWDDHETADNSWMNGANNHQPATEGDWAARKAAALRAYYEWLPIREPGPGGQRDVIQRSFDFGGLATLIMVDTRLKGRELQLETPALDALPAFLRKLNDPSRRLLDPQQEAWVGSELARSRRSGRTWQILGNQVVMARVQGPDFEALLGPAGYQAMLAKVDAARRTRLQQVTPLFRQGLPYNLDAWNGYPAARERLYAMIRRAGARAIVLAGDSHAFWVDDLKDDASRRVGAEFGASSITSPSQGDAYPPDVDLGAALAARSEEVIFSDQTAKGYVLLTLTPKQATADLIAVSTILEKPYTTRLIGRYAVAATATGIDAPRKA
jgi:alkaline phosphatase D